MFLSVVQIRQINVLKGLDDGNLLKMLISLMICFPKKRFFLSTNKYNRRYFFMFVCCLNGLASCPVGILVSFISYFLPPSTCLIFYYLKHLLQNCSYKLKKNVNLPWYVYTGVTQKTYGKVAIYEGLKSSDYFDGDLRPSCIHINWQTYH